MKHMKKIHSNNKTKTVTIISLWTRRVHGPGSRHAYDVSIPGKPTVTEMLRDAYAITNMDGRPHGKQIWSTTSGDMMVVDGVYFLVASVGFHLLTRKEADQEIVLADSLGWDEWNTRNLWNENQPGVPIVRE
jgi:hypothetical protein